MIDNRPDKRHRFKRSDSFDRQRLTAHGERDARVACLTFVWHFESAPLWSLSTNHNVGRFEPRRSEKWCAHRWKKIESHCFVWFPCSGAGWWIRKHDGGNLNNAFPTKRMMNGIVDNEESGNRLSFRLGVHPISGNRLEFVQNKDHFYFFFKIVEI